MKKIKQILEIFGPCKIFGADIRLENDTIMVSTQSAEAIKKLKQAGISGIWTGKKLKQSVEEIR